MVRKRKLVWVLGSQCEKADERQEWRNAVKCHGILVHVFVTLVVFLLLRKGSESFSKKPLHG